MNGQDDIADRTAAQRARQREGGREDDVESNTTIRVFPDGSIRFAPPFTKGEADYLRSGDPEFDETHDRCGDCVHFIPDDGCHFVQGQIDPAAYCDEFYADYGAFAHKHQGHVEVNAELVGREMEFQERDIRDFVDEIEERLQQRARERAEQSEGNPGLEDLSDAKKTRRLQDPNPEDEWPGTWEVFKSEMSFLPSWRNDEGQVIRMVENQPGEPYGFVHIGGTEDWRGLTFPELHDVFLDFMRENP